MSARFHCLGPLALLAACLYACAAPGCSCTQDLPPQPKETTQSPESPPAEEATSESPAAPRESPPDQNKGADERNPETADSTPPNTAAKQPRAGGGGDSNGAGSGPSTTGTLPSGRGQGDAGGAQDGPRDPASAVGQAAELREKASKSAHAGDSGKAFAQALSAWRIVERFAEGDEACRALAADLLADLERYGESTAGDPPDPSKPLVTQ